MSLMCVGLTACQPVGCQGDRSAEQKLMRQNYVGSCFFLVHTAITPKVVAADDLHLAAMARDVDTILVVLS